MIRGFLILIMTITTSAVAQDSLRFRNFHGIVFEGSHFFEAEGQEIFIRTAPYGMDEKGISKIIKKYNMKGAQRTDTVMRDKTVVLVKWEVKSGFALFTVCYLLSRNDSETTVVGFTGFSRNISLEHFLINAWLNNAIPDDVYSYIQANSIDFIGRTISLGNVCRWMSPHNVQCPDFGQMSWSVFDNEQAALANRDLQLAIMKNKSLTDILEEKEVPIMFEEVPVNAKRVKVRIKIPTLIMGGSNVLIAYYVTANVRGKYIACVLSQYTDDAKGNGLAPLLGKVMKLNE